MDGGGVAWAGFTLPSAIALVLFAYGIEKHGELVNSGAVHGLKIAAVAIVAQAVSGMAKKVVSGSAAQGTRDLHFCLGLR